MPTTGASVSSSRRPPAPRPIVSTVTDPNQVIVRPGNVAIPARLPLSLGSCLGLVTDAGLGDTGRGQPRARVGSRTGASASDDFHDALLAAHDAGAGDVV